MDNQKPNPIVVTWDFTEVSEFALEHAVKISKSVNKAVCLLHIVPKGCSQKDLQDKKARIDAIVEQTFKKHGIDTFVEIVEGSIFSQITEFTNKVKATVVVMGTHGMKGSQKLFGSWALKVIVGSSSPFIVVQSKPDNYERYSNIVFPIDFKSENKEKLNWAIFMGKFFNAKLHLFRYPISDKSLQRKVEANLNFAVRFLVQNKLEYEIHSPAKSKNFAKETVKFAQDINADMIMTVTTKYITIFDYMFGAKEQIIIANSAKIPVMAVNPKANFATMGQFMFGN
jgi:nucleotide-binding universal stress UspA family protein